jgi:DNA-directed RNA polymerase subunit RPC12/RpoP
MKKTIKCGSNACNQSISVSYHENDQLIECPKCNYKFTFINLVVYQCTGCKNTIKIPLFTIHDQFTCNHCTKKYSVSNPTSFAFTPYVNDEIDSLSFCPRDHWDGMEKEAYNAKLAFKKIESAYAPYKKRAVFIELAFFEEPELHLPVKSIRFLHSYFNYAAYGNCQNPKFMGTLLAFEKTNLIVEFIKKQELHDIWVANEKTKDLLYTMKTLAPYKNRIKIIGNFSV